MLRVPWGVHLETIKALGLRLLAFTCFSVGLEPLMKPSHSFLYISSKVWLNALLVFRLALCFASDDPRTSCLFTNTAHLIRYVLTCRHTLLYKDLFSLITHLKPVGGGGYSWEFVVGLCRTVVQILILFQTKKSHFPHPSSDLPEAEIMLSLLRLER